MVKKRVVITVKSFSSVVKSFLQRYPLNRLFTIEPRVMLGVLIFVACLWGAAELIDEVLEGEFQSFDSSVLYLFRHEVEPFEPIGPWFLPDMMRDVTALGSTVVLALITLSAALYCVLTERVRMAFDLIIVILLGWGLSHGLKELWSRGRPSTDLHLVDVSTYSLPSGHSMMATAVYFTVAFMIARVLPSRRTKVAVFVLAGLLVFLVGLSRVYLGVHFPSDVIAGWTIGMCWALLSALFLRVRGRMRSAARQHGVASQELSNP